ncbi:MAG: putative DCC family thiol-disulfide oxidoreductase YuxK [Pseudohongiellaceae bacterium]|jgi:predicted DCC family thiol-disulfide oxidoreductase YuxK
MVRAINQYQGPPNVDQSDRVILFDGVCKLCNTWSKFIIRYDHNRIFKLCSVQSIEGQKILEHFNLPTEYFDTMLYVEGDAYFDKSDAFLTIISKLGFPWRLLIIFRVFPQFIRDWAYDRIALNRYKLFGKYDVCVLPTPDHESRFVKRDK